MTGVLESLQQVAKPNVLVILDAAAPGGMAGVAGAVWDTVDLVGATGRLVLIMDINWLEAAGRLEVIENIQTYLESAASPVPEPSTLMLLGAGLTPSVFYLLRRRQENRKGLTRAPRRRSRLLRAGPQLPKRKGG